MVIFPWQDISSFYLYRMSCESFCKTKCCCWRAVVLLTYCVIVAHTFQTTLGSPHWFSSISITAILVFLSWCLPSKAFMTIFNHKKKPLQPLSYLLLFLTNEGPISGFLGVLIFSLLYLTLDLTVGDLWLSKSLSWVMELFKNLLWVFDFSTFKTYACILWHDSSSTSSMG